MLKSWSEASPGRTSAKSTSGAITPTSIRPLGPTATESPHEETFDVLKSWSQPSPLSGRTSTKSTSGTITPTSIRPLGPTATEPSYEETYGLLKSWSQPSPLSGRTSTKSTSGAITPTSIRPIGPTATESPHEETHGLLKSWSQPSPYLNGRNDAIPMSGSVTPTSARPQSEYSQQEAYVSSKSWRQALSFSSSNNDKPMTPLPTGTSTHSLEHTSNEASDQELSASKSSSQIVASPSSLQTQQSQVAISRSEISSTQDSSRNPFLQQTQQNQAAISRAEISSTEDSSRDHFQQPVIFHVLNRRSAVKNVDVRPNIQEEHCDNGSMVERPSFAISESTRPSQSTNSQDRSSELSYYTSSQERSLESAQNESVLNNSVVRQDESFSVSHPSRLSGEGLSASGSINATPSPHEDISSLLPTASGFSEDSPIDVEALFEKFDNMAKHMIEENTGLKHLAMTRPPRLIDENTSSTSSSPKVLNRLDELRAQRAKAVAVLHKDNRQFGNRVQVSNFQGKDHLSRYAVRPQSTGRSMMMMDFSTMEESPNPRSTDRRFQVPDLETTSTSSDRTTPSMKARALRVQLDEALQASRTIRKSQEQLGHELETFKERFYRKNNALEDKAFRAIGGI